VKHALPQNRGRLRGTPTRRGYRSGHGSWAMSTAYLPPADFRPSPNSRSPSATHRLPRPSSGGSETTRTPPTTSSGAPHSAVVAGDPNDRATTTECRPLKASFLPTTSARSAITWTRPSKPQRSTAPLRNLARRVEPSISENLAPGATLAITRLGSPPPAPRSATRSEVESSASRARARVSMNPSALATWGAREPGPISPCR
jgi:hypothetical protein